LSKKSIKSSIYKAQTIGNIEPIEFMVPYPSTQALLEGQNIKYRNHLICKDPKITNYVFFQLVQQTANWLEECDIKPKDNVLIEKLDFPQTQLLLYGLWYLGACGAIIESKIKKIPSSFIMNNLPKFKNLVKEVNSYSNNYTPKHRPLLSDTALNIITERGIVLLSHYGLLVNSSALQKSINLNLGVSIYSDISTNSSSWVIINLLLPLYCGAIIDNNNPDILFTYEAINKNSGYQLRNDWENLNSFKSHHIGICTENTAAFCVGKNAIHLTEYQLKNKTLYLKGHSVMNGYMNQSKNKMVFKNNYLAINKL